MRRFPALSAFLLFLLAAGRSFAAASDDAVQKEIRRAEEKAADAAKAGDVSGMTEIYADDVELDTPGEPPILGRVAATRWFRRDPSDGRFSRETGEAAHFEVCGDLAVETAVGPADGAISSVRVAFWRRQSDGSWKIRREIRAGEPAVSAMPPAASESPSAPAAPVLSAPVARPPEDLPSPSAEVLAIPEPRGLSSGFVRDVAEQLRSRAGRIRSAEASGSDDARRAAVERADRDLRRLVRDIGWIDVERFGTAASCDAAFIVAMSGDPALVRAAVPLMKDLETNADSAGCDRAARDAYGRLPPR